MTTNAFYAQSGGVTAVINATAAGVIETVRANQQQIGNVYAGRNGILGALTEDLIDTSHESAADIAALYTTPGGAFGSCRFKLGPIDTHRDQYLRLLEVFKAHNIGYFFYNGGGDSQDTSHKIAQFGAELGHHVISIGLPKTVDNDLPFTDTCPGFGSVAKYVATSILEASLDLRSMAANSTKVFILEVMGRHAGWIAAATGLASTEPDDPPHIILFPEVAFDEERFVNKVRKTVERAGFCVIAVSEGTRRADGSFLAAGNADAFGNV
jgi:ATP-dependent phosphofructokinase / diphosphate-dependent phosphofructokinase